MVFKQIKDLEDEVQKNKALQDQLNVELLRSRDQVQRLEAELKAARAELGAGGSSRSASQLPGLTELTELERLLDSELTKGLELEQQLADSKEKQAAAEQRATLAEQSLAEMRADFEKQCRDRQLQLDAVVKQMDQAKFEAAEKARQAEMAAKLEKRKRETDLELHK